MTKRVSFRNQIDANASHLSTLKGSADSPPRLIKVTVGYVEDEPEVFWVMSDILCGHSKFFEAALNGTFSEAQTNSVALEEEDPQIFGALLCWMHGRSEIFETLPTMEDVLELMELADKLMVEGDLGTHIVEHTMPDLLESREELIGDEIRRAYAIPGARAIGIFFAKHCVNYYMLMLRKEFEPLNHANGNDEFEYAYELQEVPGFAADLLGFVADAIRTGMDVKWPGHLYFKDPITKNVEHAQSLKKRLLK